MLAQRSQATRRRLAVLESHSAPEVQRLLSADKKSAGQTLRMVLLTGPGKARLVQVPRLWRG